MLRVYWCRFKWILYIHIENDVCAFLFHSYLYNILNMKFEYLTRNSLWPPSIPVNCTSQHVRFEWKLCAVCASWHSVVRVIKRVHKSKQSYEKLFTVIIVASEFFYLNMTHACAYSEFFVSKDKKSTYSKYMHNIT